MAPPMAAPSAALFSARDPHDPTVSAAMLSFLPFFQYFSGERAAGELGALVGEQLHTVEYFDTASNA